MDARINEGSLNISLRVNYKKEKQQQQQQQKKKNNIFLFWFLKHRKKGSVSNFKHELQKKFIFENFPVYFLN